MKKLITIALLGWFISGCKKDVPITTQSPSKIDGLELTFYKTNLQKNFQAICFVDETTGYIAGYDGALYKTTNGGSSWIALNSNTSLPLFDIFFLNKDEGFVVGGQGFCGGYPCTPPGAIILYTSNGGQTWEQVYTPPSNNPLSKYVELQSIYFVNNSVGFAVGAETILSTKDKGVTWQETKIDSIGGAMMDVEFIDDKKGFIACTFGKLLKTTDGGETWSISSPFPAIGANTLAFISENLIYSAGYIDIAKSIDGGNSWNNLPSYPTDIFKLNFITEDIGFAFGRGKYSGGEYGHNYASVYYTTNGGSTWKGNDKIQELGVIKAASFPNANVGFAIGGDVVVKMKRQ
ncbi:MAG: hypothetical protein KF900_12785 [Bacteroidetes bacterium]|nr:hypothetical protein [Bacteroidota bacterium]